MKSLMSNRISLTIRNVTLPPFVMMEGQLWGFDWPSKPGSPAHAEFLQLVTGRTKIDGLDVAVPAAVSSPNFKPWLERRVSDVLHQIESPSTRFCGKTMDTHVTLRSLPLVERSLLALEYAAFLSRFVVFDSTGLDPLGERLLVASAQEKVHAGHGLLHLRFPLLAPAEVKPRSFVVDITRLN